MYQNDRFLGHFARQQGSKRETGGEERRHVGATNGNPLTVTGFGGKRSRGDRGRPGGREAERESALRQNLWVDFGDGAVSCFSETPCVEFQGRHHASGTQLGHEIPRARPACARSDTVYLKRTRTGCRPEPPLRRKCLDCSAGSRKEVRLCPVEACTLWPYRLGKRPQSVGGEIRRSWRDGPNPSPSAYLPETPAEAHVFAR